jgi:hypothetical protein
MLSVDILVWRIKIVVIKRPLLEFDGKNLALAVLRRGDSLKEVARCTESKRAVNFWTLIRNDRGG